MSQARKRQRIAKSPDTKLNEAMLRAINVTNAQKVEIAARRKNQRALEMAALEARREQEESTLLWCDEDPSRNNTGVNDRKYAFTYQLLANLLLAIYEGFEQDADLQMYIVYSNII